MDIIEYDGSDAARLVLLARTRAVQIEGILALMIAAALAAWSLQFLQTKRSHVVFPQLSIAIPTFR